FMGFPVLLNEIQVGIGKYQRSDKGKENAGRMEFSALGAKDQAADDAAHQRPSDAQQRRHPESHADGARVEESRQHAYNKSDDDHPDDAEDAHGVSSTKYSPRRC